MNNPRVEEYHKTMKLEKTTEQDKKESINIARNLKEWFTKEAIKKMEKDFLKENLLVIKENGTVVGFLCYRLEKNKMKIIWMGVKRELQRKGIGKKLLFKLEIESKKHNLNIIQVETLTDKDKYEPYFITRNFYYKNKFKKIRYKKSKIQGNDDLVILEKELTYKLFSPKDLKLSNSS